MTTLARVEPLASRPVTAKPTQPPAAATIATTPDLGFLRGLAGRFVVFEGPDGSGKSTQFRRLAEALAAQRVELVEVREPGGTVTGEAIRACLLDKTNTGMSLRCEMLLYMASRAELVEHRILPALRAGKLVLADRFVASTLAYQGTAGGLPAADIAAVARVATRGVNPDLVVLFDLDQASAARRLSPLLDRMEAKGAAFHARVRQGYLEQAKADPRRFAVVDASRGADQVWADLLATLRARIAELPPRRAYA